MRYCYSPAEDCRARRRRVAWLLALAVFFAGFGAVGSFDVEDAELEAGRYCDNVKAGIWPAYDDAAQCPPVVTSR